MNPIVVVLKWISTIIGFGLSFMLLGLDKCSHEDEIPTDAAMIENFDIHQTEFNELKDEILTLEHGDYFPPFNRSDFEDDRDQACDIGLSEKQIHRMDSLLKATGCMRVYYNNKIEREELGRDSTLIFVYWGRGLSIGGTWKDYVYLPQFSQRYKDGSRIEEFKETSEILAETGYADTIIYKPLGEDWFIEFGHDN